AHRGEYYLADRSNAAIDIIDTRHLTFKRFLGQGLFVGAKLNGTGTAVNNDISGPDGVVTHGRWLYDGAGDSTLKVFDLDGSNSSIQTLSTGGTTRVDEMALTTDGELLLVANNAEDPPFATLFAANGDRNHSAVREITKITVDVGADIPAMEQPTWDPQTRRFYVSVPVVGGNPASCISRASPGIVVTCDGGLLVID